MQWRACAKKGDLHQPCLPKWLRAFIKSASIQPVKFFGSRRNGEAELGFQQVSELVHEADIDFLGPLPAEIQNVTIYSSGIPIGANAESAKALQAFLSAPAAAPVFRKNGMDSGHP